MTEAIVITPVKDSLNTTIKTIEAIAGSDGDFTYYIYNDFSSPATKEFLEQNQKKYNYTLVNLEDVTSTPSPNYKLVLEMAQQKALERKVPLIIVESDVLVKENTISSLVRLAKEHENAGMLGAITTDVEGHYNFPYEFEKIKNNDLVDTSHSLSFCCTLINTNLLKAFDFKQLSKKKDWYDIFLSRQSKRMHFKNYLAKGLEVVPPATQQQAMETVKIFKSNKILPKKIFNQKRQDLR